MIYDFFIFYMLIITNFIRIFVQMKKINKKQLKKN